MRQDPADTAAHAPRSARIIPEPLQPPPSGPPNTIHPPPPFRQVLVGGDPTWRPPRPPMMGGSANQWVFPGATLNLQVPPGYVDPRNWGPAGFTTTTVPVATGIYTVDTANIRGSIVSAGAGGALFFPPGTYAADNLSPLSGQVWTGTATLQRPVSSALSVIAAAGITGFVMQGLTVDGGGASNVATVNAAISLLQPTFCQFQGITVQNTPAPNAAMQLRGAIRCRVSGSQFLSVGYGILLGLVHGDAFACQGNIIEGCLIDTTTHDAVFITENLASGAFSVTGSVFGTVVSGCTMRNFGDSGVEVGSGSVGTAVTGCTFDGASSGNGLTGVLLRDAWYASVADCTVFNMTGASSIGVHAFNFNDTCRNITISNVNIWNCAYGIFLEGATSFFGSPGTALTGVVIEGGSVAWPLGHSFPNVGVYLATIVKLAVTGLQVLNAGYSGLQVGGNNASSGCTNVTVTGCKVFNSGQNTAFSVGIAVYKNSNDVTITGCRVGDDQGTRTQFDGIQLHDSGQTNITITGNDLTLGGTNANFANDGGSTSGIRLYRNLGYNPLGMLSVTPAASPWTYTAGLSPEQLYLNGGTVSAVTKNGLTLPYASAGIGYTLEPGEQITVTYTVVPTAITDRK